jgi:hypothetical protein
MKKCIKLSVVIIASLLVVSSVCNADDEFIIKPENSSKKAKKQSKNELKEDIGQATKDAFNISSLLGTQLGNLQQTLASLQMALGAQTILTAQNFKEFMEALGHTESESGKLQISLSNIQQRFSKIIEKLVDNRPPFKKAKPAELTEALNSVQKVYEHLNAEITSCQKITQAIKNANVNELQNTIKVVLSARTSLTSLNADIQKSKDLLNNTKCLNVS